MPSAGSRELDAALSVVEESIEEAIQSEGIPGASVAVVLGDQLLLDRGFGSADIGNGRGADGDTVYRIASITKLFTSTLLMMLRDEGKLVLDDPLEKYLPGIRMESPDPDPRPVTLRQLASHSGGVARDLEMDYFADGSFPSREELLDQAARLPLRIKPHTHFKYSNVGMALLGYALAEIEGQPYEELVEKRILAPLGMTSTGFSPEGAFSERGAQGYSLRREGPPDPIEYFHCRGLTPAGQLHSTTRDLAKFMTFQFNEQPAGEGAPLGGASIREMHCPVFMADDWSFATAIGWVLRRSNEVVIASHGGSLPGFVSRLGVARKEKLGVVVLSNAQTDGRAWSPDGALKTAFGAILEALSRQNSRQRASQPPRAPSEWRAYVGIYQMPFFPEVEVRMIAGSLWLARPGDKPGSEAPLRHVGGHEFTVRRGPNVGEPITFEVEDGRCRGMDMPGGRLRKL